MFKGPSSKKIQLRKWRYHYLLYDKAILPAVREHPRQIRITIDQINAIANIQTDLAASHGHLEAVYKRRQTALAQPSDFMTACQVV
jgi:hypothetical protein